MNPTSWNAAKSSRPSEVGGLHAKGLEDSVRQFPKDSWNSLGIIETVAAGVVAVAVGVVVAVVVVAVVVVVIVVVIVVVAGVVVVVVVAVVVVHSWW